MDVISFFSTKTPLQSAGGGFSSNCESVFREIQQISKAETVAQLAAALDRLRRARKVALPKSFGQIIDVVARAQSPLPLRIKSEVDSLTLARRDCSGACVVRFGSEPVHEIVVMRRIVVEQAEMFDAGFLGQAHTARPGGMSPAQARDYFILGECCVVDHQIGAIG